MKRLIEGRLQVTVNNIATRRYHQIINEAELYLANNYKEVEHKTAMQIGLCDYFRHKYPDRNWSDTKILEYIEMLEDKWGNDGK